MKSHDVISSQRSGSQSDGSTPADPLLPVRPELEQVKRRIWEQFQSEHLPEAVSSTVDYVLSQPGKMLRPALVLLSGRAGGAIGDDHTTAGAILELIHNATLLHDDVIDRSDLRRGRTTANAAWGDLSAVLLGDILLATAIDMCTRLPRDVMQRITGISRQICMGELHQTLRFRHWELPLQEYLEIITDKTACFFEGACQIGAMLSQADTETTERLGRYGLCIGVAFQIRDDVLDVTGQPEQTGKPVGGDLRQERPTLPLLHYLETVSSPREQALAHLRQLDWQTWQRALKQAGSLDYARDMAHRYSAEAIGVIEALPASEVSRTLTDIARFAVERLA